MCARYLYRQIFVQIEKGSDGWEGFESKNWVNAMSRTKKPSAIHSVFGSWFYQWHSQIRYECSWISPEVRKEYIIFSLLVMAMDELYITYHSFFFVQGPLSPWNMYIILQKCRFKAHFPKMAMVLPSGHCLASGSDGADWSQGAAGLCRVSNLSRPAWAFCVHAAASCQSQIYDSPILTILRIPNASLSKKKFSKCWADIELL